MAIRRFKATKDNTITNAYKANLTTRGTGSNMGASDILEVFSIYAQQASASSELSRIIIDFDTDSITTARSDGDIPASGSVNFYLRMYNAEHSSTVPTEFTLTVASVSQSWSEGVGIDMEDYKDVDISGSNWISGSFHSKWTGYGNKTTLAILEGGSFHSGSRASGELHPAHTSSQYFTDGTEDLEVDVTHQVEEWLNGNTASYGFGVYLTSSLETATTSYYTKKFFGRNSQYFLKRPVLEARWDNSQQDDATNFYLSSSRAPANENLNTIYLYNYVRGQLKNIPNIGTAHPDNPYILVSVYSGNYDNSEPSGSKIIPAKGGGVSATNDLNITGGYVSTGIYSASFAYTSSGITTIFPVWHSASTEYLTASAISVKTFAEQRQYPTNAYIANITNLQAQYSTNDVAHFRVFTRSRDWNPNIYNVASAEMQPTIIEKMYYKVIRAVDEQIVISYATGSGDLGYTKLSYDASGSYFDLDMGIFETDFSYQISFLVNDGSDYIELKDKFNFRVVDENDIPG